MPEKSADRPSPSKERPGSRFLLLLASLSEVHGNKNPETTEQGLPTPDPPAPHPSLPLFAFGLSLLEPRSQPLQGSAPHP